MDTVAASEFETFLRACLRLRHDASGRDAVQATARQLEHAGDALRAAIEVERIGPLLYRTVGEAGTVSPALARALRESYHLTAMRNLLLLRELGGCLSALAAGGVPVIVLKGAALAETVYGNVALRPMGDVDLLVRRRDLTATGEILATLGYAAGRAETHPGALADYENELLFGKPGRVPAYLDVHWSLFDSPYYQDRIAMDWFWETARSASIADVPTLVLGPEALIIHLCGHLALHHMNTGLLWWHDVAEVLRFPPAEIDWPTLVSRTREYGLLQPVHEVLTRVAGEWGAPVPAEVLDALRAAPRTEEERRIVARLTAEQQPPGQRFWTDVTSMRGWRQRLRFAWTNLLPSPAYMRQRYRIPHPLLLPFYYPYRWLRGLRGLR